MKTVATNKKSTDSGESMLSQSAGANGETRTLTPLGART